MKGTATPGLSRREFLAGASALGGMAIASAAAPAQITTMAPFEKLPPYGNNTLPAGVKPRLVPNVNGLTVNMLEAGTQGRPLVLLLHGFPNLGYSWRKVMPAFADAGYYVIAPDCRGFGRTVGWDRSWDADPDAVPDAQHGARPDRARLCARLPEGRDRRRARSRSAHRHVCRDRSSGHVSPPDDGFVGGRRTAIVPFRRARNENPRTPLRNSTRSSRSSIRRAETIRITGPASRPMKT